jgi:hypothetical protein
LRQAKPPSIIQSRPFPEGEDFVLQKREKLAHVLCSSGARKLREVRIA